MGAVRGAEETLATDRAARRRPIRRGLRRRLPGSNKDSLTYFRERSLVFLDIASQVQNQRALVFRAQVSGLFKNALFITQRGQEESNI